jgi:signal transduction histidine kinase
VILLVSILIRLLAMAWSIVLLRRIEDRRMAFLTVMLFLMALRQSLTLVKSIRTHGMHKLTSVGEFNELPGLAVSIFAAVAVVFLARIILERRELAQTLDTTVVESQKMEAVGQFAGGVAHDFNNMLTVILGNVDLGKRTVEPGTPGYESLEAVGEAANRAALLTQQLLSFSRRDPIELTTIDANELVESLSPIVQNLVGEHIDVQTSFEEEVALFQADRRQIEHVFVNLAVNARDAMPNGGRLSLTVQVDESEPDSIAISMKDTGLGIADDVVDRIFEPFFTTKPVGQGTGLGLATCHAVVARSGGEIRVDSELGTRQERVSGRQ